MVLHGAIVLKRLDLKVVFVAFKLHCWIKFLKVIIISQKNKKNHHIHLAIPHGTFIWIEPTKTIRFKRSKRLIGDFLHPRSPKTLLISHYNFPLQRTNQEVAIGMPLKKSPLVRTNQDVVIVRPKWVFTIFSQTL